MKPKKNYFLFVFSHLEEAFLSQERGAQQNEWYSKMGRFAAKILSDPCRSKLAIKRRTEAIRVSRPWSRRLGIDHLFDLQNAISRRGNSGCLQSRLDFCRSNMAIRYRFLLSNLHSIAIKMRLKVEKKRRISLYHDICAFSKLVS